MIFPSGIENRNILQYIYGDGWYFYSSVSSIYLELMVLFKADTW